MAGVNAPFWRAHCLAPFCPGWVVFSCSNGAAMKLAHSVLKRGLSLIAVYTGGETGPL